jgi:hypothetical protein
MTHSFFIHLLVTLVAALFAAAILWGEHYHPWGKPLDQRLNYVLGTLAMLIPYSFLILFWMLVPPGDALMLGLWSLVGLWLIVGVSGLTVYLLYEADAKREARQRAAAAEAAEKAARE